MKAGALVLDWRMNSRQVKVLYIKGQYKQCYFLCRSLLDGADIDAARSTPNQVSLRREAFFLSLLSSFGGMIMYVMYYHRDDILGGEGGWFRREQSIGMAFTVEHFDRRG